jgi:hypothetical protein
MLKYHQKEQWVRRVPKLVYILTVVYRGRWDKRRERNDYVPVNAALLQRILGPLFAKPAITLLLDLGLLETDNHYRVARSGQWSRGKSRGYRFKEPYRSAKFKEVKDVHWSHISSLLAPELRIQPETAAHQFLFENLTHVTMDESVYEFLWWFEAKSDFQRDYYERSVDFIRGRDWFFSTDPNTGRVFNNVTLLPKKLRGFVRYDGKSLIEIDVANCQPLLLLSLYDNEPERAQFEKAVVGGTFYELLNAQLKRKYAKSKRDKLKKAVFRQIFFGKIPAKPKSVCVAFAQMFPLLYDKILKVKKPDYRKLALLLQKSEADIIIGKAVDRIARTSRIPILTVHDSILTVPEHVEEVKERLETAFLETLGVKPSLKVKKLASGPSTAVSDAARSDLAASPVN